MNRRRKTRGVTLDGPDGGVLLLTALPVTVLGGDLLQTSGFTTCLEKSSITVEKLKVQYDRSVNRVTFDVAGSSSKVQNVKASLTVTAYGRQVYEKKFDPCAEDTKVEQLCPGTYHCHGYLAIGNAG